MRNLILSIGLLCTMGLFAQVEETVSYDINKDLYVVYTDENNFHHVSEDGTLNGSFSHSFNNVVIKGFMKNGKRHGTLITMINGVIREEVQYSHGIAVSHTKHIK